MKRLALSLFAMGMACGVDPVMTPQDMAATPTVYSCDQTAAASPSCKEFTNISATQRVDGLQGLCPVALTPAACPRPNLLGGCRANNASYTLTTWFYPGTMFMNSTQVQTYCGAAFVAAT